MQCAGIAGAIGTAVFFFLWAVMMLGFVVGWIFLLVAAWRAMKAHESVAASLHTISEKMH